MNEHHTATNDVDEIEIELVEAAFTDANGTEWPLRLDFPDIFRIRRMTEVDLLAKDPFKPCEDMAVFCAVMFAAWSPLCEERDIDEEGFVRLLSADGCCEAAQKATLAAAADFFHRNGRKAQARALRLGLQLAPKQAAEIDEQLDLPTMRRLAEKSMEVMSLKLKRRLAKREAKMDALLGREPTNSPGSRASAT